jgi:hypothetical protein
MKPAPPLINIRGSSASLREDTDWLRTILVKQSDRELLADIVVNLHVFGREVNAGFDFYEYCGGFSHMQSWTLAGEP